MPFNFTMSAVKLWLSFTLEQGMVFSDFTLEQGQGLAVPAAHPHPSKVVVPPSPPHLWEQNHTAIIP